jgi:hypothetical protein
MCEWLKLGTLVCLSKQKCHLTAKRETFSFQERDTRILLLHLTFQVIVVVLTKQCIDTALLGHLLCCGTSSGTQTSPLLTPGPYLIKLFTAVMYSVNKLMFVPGKPFHYSRMLVSKAKTSYLMSERSSL